LQPSNEQDLTAGERGLRFFSRRLNDAEQRALALEVFTLVEEAPFYRPVTPWGKPMSVEMTNLGPLGWVSSSAGYGYQPTHPVTGARWPPIPGRLMNLWAELADEHTAPDACLVNLYRAGARMGLHQDKDEADFSIPVLSVSLGDTAAFRVGGQSRRSPTRSIWLASGDVCVLSGADRLAFHGIERVVAGSSDLIPGGGRLNLTLRRVTPRPAPMANGGNGGDESGGRNARSYAS
jgi:alkylated DNA repair protein (DNA oxidative demethylase)